MVAFGDVIELFTAIKVAVLVFGHDEVSDDFIELFEQLQQTIIKEHEIKDLENPDFPLSTILGPQSTVAYHALKRWFEGGGSTHTAS